MFKRYLFLGLFMLVMSCPAFANEWDGITYKVMTKNITFQLEGDSVFFSIENQDIEDHITSVSDETDYYKIMLDSERFIMLDKKLDHGKVVLDNTAYMFREQ